jgi:excisionase family DNA binding protein
LSRMVNGEVYYTASEAARYLGIARDTFNRNVKGNIRTYRIGALKREYYRQSDLDRYKGVTPIGENEQGK